MSTVIISCSSLTHALSCAQEKEGTNYPVYNMDRTMHSDPPTMRQHILDAISEMPKEVDTVLVSMGFCGRSWGNISVDKRIVIPKVDDCISLLLHTDDNPTANLKEWDHMYMRDSDDYDTGYQKMKDSLCERMGEEEGAATFDRWFASIDKVSIIDTGTYDSYAPEFLALAEQNASVIHAELDHVPGSNLMLEKLVSGRWDDQFIVCEPYQTLDFEDFGIRPYGERD